MTISSPGIGSNLDVNGIVSQLIAVDSRPLTTLARQEASFQSKLSAIGSVAGSLSTFQNALHGLSDITKFQGVRVTAADATIASVSGSSAAVPGSYALEVTQLAQAQKLTTTGQASSGAVIGNGTLTFDFGTISGGSVAVGVYSGASFTSNAAGVKTVTIDPSSNTLSGIRDAINSAKIGVTASIVNDGSAAPYRLVLTSTVTGASNSLKISVAGDAALSTLLSQNPAGAQALTENITAQNSQFKVDGIAISKSSNTVADVIAGVTLNLTGKSAAGVTTNITVTRDSAAVSNAVTQFVNAYNQISQTLADVSAYDPATKQAAILNGDSSIRSIQTQIRSVLNAPVGGGNSAYTLLSQVGVSLQKTGQLTLDTAKLQSAVENNFSDIAGLFAAVGKSTDSLVSYVGATANTKPGAYPVTISQLARQGSATGLATVTGAGNGKSVGSAAAGLTIDATNDTLIVQLDGVSSTVALTRGVYASAAALDSNVQTQINASPAFSGAGAAVTVSDAAGVLTITSNKTGSGSAASVTGGNGKLNLLGATPTVTAGFDTSITAGSNDTLNVSLNGASTTITLAAGNYSFASLAAAVQGQINGAAAFSSAGASVTVSQNAGVLKITSNAYGASAGVGVTGGTARAALFGGAPTLLAGLDVVGTINGATGVGVGQLLTGATGNAAEGLNVLTSGSTLGARGTINYSQGYAFQLDKLITGLLGSSGPISSRTSGINASISSIGKNKLQLQATIAANEKRYRAQFTALDTVISGLQATSSFLTQQLASLPKIQ